MTDQEILLQLTGIFRDVFANDQITLDLRTTAEDIPEWDSMSQVTLAVEIEHRLGIKFKSAEMEELTTVRELVDLIKTRLPAQAA